jgi:GR25 family glycosyltransferase involved in LPS biosynthesis
MNKIIDHIYVINMKKDKERLNKFKNQVKDLFTYEIWEGVDVKNPKYAFIYNKWLLQTFNVGYCTFNWKYYIERYKDLRDAGILRKDKAWWHWNNYGKKELRSCNPDNEIVNQEQLGCLISHLEIIKDAKKNNYKNILILEDDIIISNDYRNQLQNLLDFVKNNTYNIIYLGASQHCWKDIKFLKNHYIAKNTTGGFSYIVNSCYYDEMICGLDVLNKPADVFLSNKQKNEEFIVLYPNMFYADLENSNISMKRNNKEWFSKFKWNTDIKINKIENNKILIILPTLNRSQNINNTIDMFKNQTYENFDLLIINDGSNTFHTKQLRKLKERYKNSKNIIFHENEKNLKIAKTLNKGIKFFLKNKYKYLTWVSDDNLYYNNYLEELIKPKEDFTYSNFLFDDKILGFKNINNNKYNSIDDFIKSYRGCASFMWSKNAILKIGYYSEDLEGGEDYEYLLRTFHNIGNIQHVDKCLMTYIRDGDCGYVKKKQKLLDIKEIINSNYLSNLI